MTRNGSNFGIKISGIGDQWFTAPVNTPQDYSSGFLEADANPDIGDSAITETFGIGGAAMVAARSNPLCRGHRVVWMQHVK